MTTIQNLVDDTKGMLSGSLAESLNLLGAAYTAGSGVIRLRYLSRNIVPGTVLTCGLNTWYVLEGDPTGERIIVLPSYDGGPDVSVAESARVDIRPRATTWRVFSEIKQEISALSSPANGLYSVKQWTSPVDPVWGTYPVPAEVGSVSRMLSARYRFPGSPDRWVWIGAEGLEFQPDIDTGQIVRINRVIPAGTNVEFSAAGPFGAPAALEDTLDSLYIPDTFADIPPLRAAAAILMSTESRRLQPVSQGDPRRAEEVPATSNSSVAREYLRLHKARVDEEYARLIRLWPWEVPMPGGGRR